MITKQLSLCSEIVGTQREIINVYHEAAAILEAHGLSEGLTKAADLVGYDIALAMKIALMRQFVAPRSILQSDRSWPEKRVRAEVVFLLKKYGVLAPM